MSVPAKWLPVAGYLGVVALGMVAGSLVVFVGRGAPGDPARPVLAGARELDFGVVNAGQELEGNFQLTNTGSTVLTVQDLKVACSCTVPDPPVGALAPGETWELGFRYTPQKGNGEEETTITLLTRELPPIALRAKARVLGGYPARVHFGTVRPGLAVVKVIPIHSVGREPLKIHRMEYDDARFAVEQMAPAGAGAPLQLYISLRDQSAPGAFRERLRLITNDDPMPEKLIALHGTVLPPVAAKPRVQEWDFAELLPQKNVPRFSLYGESCRNLTIRRLYFKGRELAYRTRATGEGVDIELPGLRPQITSPLERGVLTVTGSCGEAPFAVKIPFFALNALNHRESEP